MFYICKTNIQTLGYIYLPSKHPTTSGQSLDMFRKRLWLQGLCATIKNTSCCGQLWVRHMFCGRDLWWTIPLHIFHWSCWDTLWIPNDQVYPSQTLSVQVPVISRHGVTWSFLDSLKSSANQDWYLPVPTYGSTWVVLWLLFCRSAPSTFPATWSTL